jgi:hypothetical protein
VWVVGWLCGLSSVTPEVIGELPLRRGEGDLWSGRAFWRIV